MSTYCKAGGRGPNASPLNVENGSPVEISCPHQTTTFFVSVQKSGRCCYKRRYLISTYAFDGCESAIQWHESAKPTDLATTWLNNSKISKAPDDLDI